MPVNRKRAALYIALLLLSAAYVVWQILAPREDWLYPAICAVLILVGVADLVIRKPRRTLLWALLCLVYLTLPAVWGQSSSKSWVRHEFPVFYLPLGCMVCWIIRLKELFPAKPSSD